MSSARVKSFKRELNYSAVFTAPNSVVFTTQTPHYLVTGNLVDIIEFAGTAQLPNMVVNVIDTNTFTLSGEFIVSNGTLYIIANGNTLVVAGSVDITDAFWMSGKVIVRHFSTGISGYQIMTTPRGQTGSSVIQSFVSGTGTAVYTISGSLDGIHWTLLTTLTHTAVDGNTQSYIMEPNWAYVGLSITSIGAATTLSALYSA